MEVWLQYLIALIVGCHGLVYLIRGLFQISGLYEGWRERSLLLRNAVTGDRLKALTRALWTIAGIGTVSTGIMIVLASSTQGLWRPLAIAASVVGILSFAASWDGQGRRSANQGLVGMLLSLAILLSAIAFPQAFG